MAKFVLKNIVKDYPESKNSKQRILDGVDFEWNENESIAIMGESGSGKSTLAKIMLGLEQPSLGEISFDNDDITKWSARTWKKNRKIIQGVFQDASGTLNNGLSVYKNLEEGLINLTDFNKIERKKIILELMERAELKDSLLNIKTKNLSGGEQRRLALIRSLSVKPKFLILDEVTGGLDFDVENDICNLLIDYHNKHKISYLLITHDEQVARKVAKKILYIENGRFIKLGVKRE